MQQAAKVQSSTFFHTSLVFLIESDTGTTIEIEIVKYLIEKPNHIISRLQ